MRKNEVVIGKVVNYSTITDGNGRMVNPKQSIITSNVITIGPGIVACTINNNNVVPISHLEV